MGIHIVSMGFNLEKRLHSFDLRPAAILQSNNTSLTNRAILSVKRPGHRSYSAPQSSKPRGSPDQYDLDMNHWTNVLMFLGLNIYRLLHRAGISMEASRMPLL